MTLFKQSGMPDSQRCPLNFNLKNNKKDIVDFLSTKLVNSYRFLHCFNCKNPQVTFLGNNQFNLQRQRFKGHKMEFYLKLHISCIISPGCTWCAAPRPRCSSSTSSCSLGAWWNSSASSSSAGCSTPSTSAPPSP